MSMQLDKIAYDYSTCMQGYSLASVTLQLTDTLT